MKIQFVNHASYIIRHKAISIICDPWLSGSAFHNGWMHLTKTNFSGDDFIDITHIWFSHEHPDHFSPSNIISIPKHIRQKITVMYQQTIDNKVINFCEKMGFKEIIEMKPLKKYSLSEDITMVCSPYTDGDSYMLCNVDGTRILNLNDCVIDTEEQCLKLRSKIGKADILFTQFGYANKIGNIDEPNLRLKKANEKLEILSRQVKIFEPTTVIPFASFIYFSHEENHYMNDSINNIKVVNDYLEKSIKVNCNVMFPDDEWEVGQAYESKESVQKWMVEFNNVHSKEYFSSQKIDLSEIEKNWENYSKLLLKNNPNQHTYINKIQFNLLLIDYHKVFNFSFTNGFKEVKELNPLVGVALSSEALQYVFNNPWGGGTLHVNGRYQTGDVAETNKFMLLTAIADTNNRGLEYQFHVKPSIAVRVKNKIVSLMGKAN